MCTSNRDDRKLENTVKQRCFTRSELKLESVHQESPRSDFFRKRASKPLLNQRQRQKHLTWAKEKKNWTVAQWSKVLFSDESKCCISFGNQGPRVWRKSGEKQNPCFLKSCEVSTVCDKADKLYGDADLLFQQDLAPAHTSLSSHVYTLNACMRNNQSSGCRPKYCYNQSESFFPHDHHFHDRSSLSWPSIRSLLHIPNK